MANSSERISPQPNPLEINLTETKIEGVLLNQGFTVLVWAFAFTTVAVLGLMSWVIFQQAQPAIQTFGLKFLFDSTWNVGQLVFGAAPYIYGTILSSAIALILALPIGLAVAIVTSEDFMPEWVRSPVAFVVELIAAIPSVIIGLWGIFILVPFLLPIQQWLHNTFKWIPLFSTEPFGPGMFSAGVLLSIMILPTIAAISRDVMVVVPKEMRSASMALGATRWETIFRVLLPTAVSGILGAAMLALGRALGETMAVTMVIGNSAQISVSLLDLGYTIPAVLVNKFPEALEKLEVGALMYLALILFVLTLVVNLIAVLMVKVLGQQQQ